MTVSATPRKAGPFDGNGVTTSFPFDFKVFTKTELQVVLATPIGVESTLVLDSDYTVNLNPDQDSAPGGSVSYEGPPVLPAGWKLVVLGATPVNQVTDITNVGRFNPDVIERTLDRTTVQIQQLQEAVTRAVQVPPSSATDPKNLLQELTIQSNEVFDARDQVVNISVHFSDEANERLDVIQAEGDAINASTVALAAQQRVEIRGQADAVLSSIGYLPPQPYAAGLSMTVPNQTVSYFDGVSTSTYAPILDFLPFTTSGSFETAKFRLIQGVSGADLAADRGSLLVGFLQSGSGVIKRRTEEKLREILSVDDFGAVGNGVVDDTIAIRNAVDYAITTVRDLHFVAGKTYRITGEINFPKKHANIIREFITFDGHGCRIVLDGSNFTGFGFTKTGVGTFDNANYYFIFRGFNFKSTPNNGCIAIRPSGFITSQYVNLHFHQVDYPFWAQKADPRGTPDYVQSPRIFNCYSVLHKRFFTAPRVYDFVMKDTLIDAGVDGILIDFGPTGQSAYCMRIRDSTIQSQTGIGLSVGGATVMLVDGTYFENNGREYVANHSGTTVNYGGGLHNNWIQGKAVPLPERLAAFDLGGASSSGFKMGGNVAQDQNLFNFSSSALGYFDGTNDRSAMPFATLYHPTVRPSNVRVIFNDGARWGLLWGPGGGMVINTVARAIEYTHTDYDYLDPTDNVRIPIIRGVAYIAPAGFGGGLDGMGVSPQQAPSLYPQKAFARGSFLGNPTTSELGTAGSKYVVHGWSCTVSGRPGTWVQCRSLTGA